MGMMSAANPESMKRLSAVMKRAREIDPEAFKGFKVTHYGDEQQTRQRVAMEKAEREIPRT